MAEINSGLRSILAHPAVYRFFSNIVGGSLGKRRIVDQFLRPDPAARILDLGCGPARILDFLPLSVSYTGIDINSEYIKDARRRYGTRGRFISSKIGEEVDVEEGTYDMVIALGVLHHLEDHEAHELCQLASRSLRDGGVLVTLDCVYIEEQPSIARYIISRDRGTNVRAPEGYRDIAETCFPEVQEYVVHDLLRIPYTHYIMRCTKNGELSLPGA